MISVTEACKIATERTGCPFVDVITNVKEGLLIGVLGSDGEAPDMAPLIVYNDGSVDAYFPPEHGEEIKKGKSVPVPQKYQYHS